MTVEELIVEGKKQLHSHEVKMLLANVLNYNTLELLNHLDEEVNNKLKNKYLNQVSLFKQNVPIQYIIGNVDFYGNNFVVNNKVLIPRFETEELVENTIKYIDKYFCGDEKLIDLGCGSGVIGITLKKNIPTLDVTCLDISDEALKITKENANRLNTDINIIKGDMLDNINSRFSIIISNPPYIKDEEEIDDIVRNNEPSIALFAGRNGLKYYEQILSKAKNNLTKKFLIALEIGCTQKKDIINIVNQYFDSVKIDCIKDLSNKDRMIFIYNV